MDRRLGAAQGEADAAMTLVLSRLDEYQGQPNALFCADEAERGAESGVSTPGSFKGTLFKLVALFTLHR